MLIERRSDCVPELNRHRVSDLSCYGNSLASENEFVWYALETGSLAIRNLPRLKRMNVKSGPLPIPRY